MLIAIIKLLIFIFCVTIIAIPISAAFVILRARLRGRYLNRYFIIHRKRIGAYELHHQPAFGYYYAGKRKFHRLTMEAIRKFQAGYPDHTLIANTLTLTSRIRKGTPIEGNRFLVTFARLMSDMLILFNLANYRRAEGQWRFAKLIKSVHRSKPMHYVLVGGQP